MSNELPDRLSLDPRSPHHDAALLERGVGIRFNGSERTNVEEYCISEGWIRVVAGKSLDRRGNPMTMKLQARWNPTCSTPKRTPPRATEHAGGRLRR